MFGDESVASGHLRRLYLVTNCADVRMIRADGTHETLATPRPDLYEWDVRFDGQPLRFVGRNADGSISETTLRPWGDPSAFTLQAVPMAGPTYRCSLQVQDAAGAPVLAYEGEAQMALPPGARASLIAGNRIPVHGGQAVFYVEGPRDGSELRIEGALDDFPPQTLRLSSGMATEGRP